MEKCGEVDNDYSTYLTVVTGTEIHTQAEKHTKKLSLVSTKAVHFRVVHFRAAMFGYSSSGYPLDIYWFAKHKGRAREQFDQFLSLSLSLSLFI